MGLEPVSIDALHAENVDESAQTIAGLLDGEPGPARDIAALNAGAALVVAGLAGDLAEGLQKAQGAIDAGAGRAALDALVRWTNQKS